MSKRLYVFPGQGSQHLGMGEELFERYPDEVKTATDILGYSVVDLCLNDAQGVLNKTQYTQPALYIVTVLHYLNERGFLSVDDVYKDKLCDSLVFAGHSLGEYSALFAAGAFSFETGVRLVQKRGELMANAPSGAMAAVLDISIDQVKELLNKYSLSSIDIANINSKNQTIVSGLYDEIVLAETVFEKNNARFVPLNVSAAFHSRYMSDTAKVFSEYLQTVSLNPLRSLVISNFTAKPYGKTEYNSLMIDQIDHSVRWYESISGALKNGMDDIVEVGPGVVLTKLVNTIKQEPVEIVGPSWELETESKSLFPKDVNEYHRLSDGVYLMFAGQGTQYYGMGAELYRKNSVFREALNSCNDIVEPILGYSIVDEIYQLDADQPFDYIRVSHPAIVCFGYSLYRVIAEYTEVSGVIGHSLGEYIAAIVSGILTLKDCLTMVCIQAQLLDQYEVNGSLISVIANEAFFDGNAELFEKVEVAAINTAKNRMYAGDKNDVSKLANSLESSGIISVILPVEYAFHSSGIDSIRAMYIKAIQDIPLSTPSIPTFSCNGQMLSGSITHDHFWDAIRKPVFFQNQIQKIKCDATLLVDMSATGSLSGLIQQVEDIDIEHLAVINQFGNNLDTLNNVIERLAS